MNRWSSCLDLPTPGIVRRALAGALVVVAAGCGNLTAGGFGEAAVAMSGDAPDNGPNPQAAVVGVQPSVIGPLPTDHDDDQPEGEFEAELRIFLVSADGEMVPITDGEVRVRVDLEGTREPIVGSRTVPATTYRALRMIFTEIDAQVDAGLVINGVPVTGPIDVEIDDVTLVVDRGIDLEIGDGQRAELLVDLNAESWLASVDPVTLTVDAQIFADLVSVRIR